MTLEVLLIGLGDEVLGDATEDARARHLRYAEGVAHLHLVVWQPSGASSEPVSLSPNVTVYPVGQGGRVSFVRDALRVGAEIIRQRPIKVISTQEPFYTALVGLWLKRRGARLQIQNHSDFFDNPYWLAERPLWNHLLNIFGKWAVHHAAHLRVVNTVTEKKYVALGIPAGRIDVLPVPVDLVAFEKPVGEKHVSALRVRWNIPDDSPVLLWAGRTGPVKDLETLLQAFAVVHQEYSKAHLILAGDFSRASHWSDRARKLGLMNAVHFVGPLSRDELPACYALSSLYIHSSVYEGFGRVMLEAAAAGRASVATSTAGALDIVRDKETGLLCPIRDSRSLAGSALQLIADPERARRMGAAARVRARQQFDPERLTHGIVAAWHACAGHD